MAQRLAPIVDIAEITAADELSRFERLLSELSAGFINLPAGQIDEVIDSSLRRIVETLHIDRCSLTRALPAQGQFQTLHSFATNGFEPVPKSNSSRMFPWAFERYRAGQALVFSHPDELPPEAHLELEGYRAAGFGSHVGQPIMVAGQLFGVLGFGSLRHTRHWPDALVARMRLLADIYGNALARKLAQNELDRALDFERLASRLLASRLMAGPAVHDADAIEAALGDIGRFLGAGQVALWQRLPRQAAFSSTHRWSASGPSQFDGADMAGQPWFVAQLLAGAPVLLDREAPWPAAACAELRTREGLNSLLAVPFSSGREVAGALCCTNVADGHRWPHALVPGAGLLAEVFASLHARQAAERREHAAELEATQWRERLAHLVRVHTAGEMSAALAHEINQPLGAIENYALAARRRIDEPDPDLALIASLLDKLRGQALRAGNVVTRVRGLVQRHAVEPKSLDVEQAVRACIDMLRMDCELRDIRVELQAEPMLPAALADEIHLQQVILNLLRNAMEACEVQRAGVRREIAVELARQGPAAITIRVADRGAGIAEGELERVFESFYSTKASGLGIGLAICRRLVEAHAGELWATHNPGGGAVFHCTLPLAGSE